MKFYTFKQLLFFLCMNRENIGECYIDVCHRDYHDVRVKLHENKFCGISESEYYYNNSSISNLRHSIRVLVNKNLNSKVSFEQIGKNDKFLKIG